VRVRKPKRGNREAAHVRFYRWELDSPAFRSLSPPSRCLLLELKALYNGRNNGELFLSVREAARRLGIGKSLAAKCFRELCDRGFIKIAKQGAFNVKAASWRGDATAWLLTEHPPGDAAGAGSRDFMRWRAPPAAPENHSTVRRKGRAVPTGGHSSAESPV
jgi:hypothetical protein